MFATTTPQLRGSSAFFPFHFLSPQAVPGSALRTQPPISPVDWKPSQASVREARVAFLSSSYLSNTKHIELNKERLYLKGLLQGAEVREVGKDD